VRISQILWKLYKIIPHKTHSTIVVRYKQIYRLRVKRECPSLRRRIVILASVITDVCLLENLWGSNSIGSMLCRGHSLVDNFNIHVESESHIWKRSNKRLGIIYDKIILTDSPIEFWQICSTLSILYMIKFTFLSINE